MDRLPSFSGLTAFYAAARLGTLTEAARELNVSQPAVSRRIATLEADLGCPLFDRSRKPVRLTQAGKDLLQALHSGLGQIEASVAQIRQSARGRVVTVTAPSGFVGFWLIPRLAELEAAFPELTIQIMSQEYGEALRPGDIVVRFGLPDDGPADEERLLGNAVYPVASPLYLDRRAMTRNRYDFSAMTLLTMEAARRHWHDWPRWFETAYRPAGTRGADPADTSILTAHSGPATMGKVLDFNSYAMIINAALAGQGVCLCWDGVLDSFIDTGALVRLDAPSAASSRGYFAAARDGHAARADVGAILDWIVVRARK